MDVVPELLEDRLIEDMDSLVTPLTFGTENGNVLWKESDISSGVNIREDAGQIVFMPHVVPCE